MTQLVIELISKTFHSRNAAHIAHWRTKNYARHVALNDFYDGVIEIVDGLVECYQGNFGIIEEDIPEVAPGYTQDIVERFNDELVWIEANRGGIAQGVTALENTIDELLSLYLKTLYKLENLS
jgi:hypothetical protein